MLRGKDIVQLAEEILRQAENKRDFVTSTTNLIVHPDGEMVVGSNGSFLISEHAHNQIAERIKIPKGYYDRIRKEHPQLYAQTVNTFFDREPERRMVRTLDNKVRAFMSDRYRRIDNEDVAEVILPILREYPGIQIQSAEITERRLYITALYPKVQGEVKVGDIIQAGLQVSNSEIGVGKYMAAMFALRLNCLNGFTFKELGVNQMHVGKRVEEEGELARFYSEETQKLDDATILSKTKDVVRALLDGSSFDLILNKMRQTLNVPIIDVEKSVEQVSTRFQLNEDERKSVLRNIIEEGSLNQYGLANGITFAANQSPDYDRAMELSRLGGQIIELSPSEFSVIAA